jgi:hypothetical protein
MVARIAALAAVVIMGTAANAFAQSAGYDSLNPLNKRAPQGIRRPAPAPMHYPIAHRDQATWRPAPGSYEAYLVEYRRYLAQVEHQRSSRGNGFGNFLQGLSASLSVADQAISVYEHSLDAKALARYYSGR